MGDPAAPDAETREQLLDVLGEFIARGGEAPLLLPPVLPGVAAFPEPWARTRGGVELLLRRLVWHAEIDREIELEDRRAGAPPTERKPATRAELIEVRRKSAVFALGFIGEDDIVGTLAHEVGVLHAALNRPDDADPYRTAEAPVIAVDPDVDLERGSIATVYLGLGVLAVNAAHQQHVVLERQIQGNVASVAAVVNAGYLDMSSLAFLVAVQAVVRGETAPPPGLELDQRAAVGRWIAALRERAGELRERLGIAADFHCGTRPTPTAFTSDTLEAEPLARLTAFRWQTHRGGVGLIAGTVLGVGMAFAASRGIAPWLAFGGATTGHVIGRRVRVPRCSACATTVSPDATTCRKCGASLRGDIASLSERLDAEERLDGTAPPFGGADGRERVPAVDDDGNAG